MKTDNELIAEFDGWLFFNDATGDFPNGYYMIAENGKLSIPRTVDEFEYDTSWDWLMPVVEKIESLGFATKFRHEVFNVSTPYHDIEIFSLNENNGYKRVACCMERISKIEVVHKTVVEFIKWYNQQKP